MIINYLLYSNYKKYLLILYKKEINFKKIESLSDKTPIKWNFEQNKSQKINLF